MACGGSSCQNMWKGSRCWRETGATLQQDVTIRLWYLKLTKNSVPAFTKLMPANFKQLNQKKILVFSHLVPLWISFFFFLICGYYDLAKSPTLGLLAPVSGQEDQGTCGIQQPAGRADSTGQPCRSAPESRGSATSRQQRQPPNPAAADTALLLQGYYSLHQNSYWLKYTYKYYSMIL